MTRDPPTPVFRPEGFDFEKPDESWLARVRGALAPNEDRPGTAADANTHHEGHVAGARLGAYELVRPIGAGGMGAVWLARRADGLFERDVAIKLIKRGMDTDAVVRRFRTERHVLASLLHPHIARLYDGGSTSDGRPFLVMEYVEGQPILAYSESRGLDVEQRLHLFRSVCLAVHHAHRHLVLHRDIKPSNIMVTPEGAPMLLDFGIAKLLDEQGFEGASLTATDFRALTPRYASPEQMRGERLTTAADVYSLGVVLYELLTGRAPYELESGSHSEIERAVLAQEPTRPSLAARRRDDLTLTQSRRLHRRIRGDLDTIVMTALEKDTARRYSSTEQLAEDIRRHLEGLPLLARRAGLARRALRIVRRNRTTVVIAAIAATAALSVTAAVLTYSFLAPRWAQEHLRKAHLALLNPEQANLVWSATFFEGGRMLSRDRPPRADAQTLRAALSDYDRALRFDSGHARVEAECDIVRLALAIAESPGVPPAIPPRLDRVAPLACDFAGEWARVGRIPEIIDERLDGASQSDLRCLGLLAMLTSDIPDALRAWSRLSELEADPLIESLLGVLYLSVEQPERAYPRLLSAFRQYPECGFVCTSLADAALDCGDAVLAGALLAKAEGLEKRDDVHGLERVRMRYYLATGHDDKAAELVASQPLMRRNPVAVVQYARHRFEKGAHREALELLGPWCIASVGWPWSFSPFRINREYLKLTQRWWSGMSASQREELMLEAMEQPAGDLRSLFRILHEYHKCTQRLERVQAGPQAVDRVGPVPVLDELGGEVHREVLDWHARMEIGNAYRWQQFAQYPPELRQLQVQAWLDPEASPSRDEIERMYESWKRGRGLDTAPPYVKLLPAPELGDERWGGVHLSGGLALIRDKRAAHGFHRTNDGWRRGSSLPAPPGTTLGSITLEANRAVLFCRPEDPTSGERARIVTFDLDENSQDWQLRSDQSVEGPAMANFASVGGLAATAPSGPVAQLEPRVLQVLRYDPSTNHWRVEQTITDWSRHPGRLNFLRPALAAHLIVVGSYCEDEPPCDSLVKVYRYDPADRRWSLEADLVPPADAPLSTWSSIAATHDLLAASAGGGGEYEVYIYRRDSHAREWRLETQLSKLLPSPSTWLGCFSLDIDGDRVTAAGGSPQPDLLDWHTEVHVFDYDRASQSWSYTGSARPIDRGFGDSFGEHDLDGDTLIVSAPGQDAAGIDAGAAYIFDLTLGISPAQ